MSFTLILGGTLFVNPLYIELVVNLDSLLRDFSKGIKLLNRKELILDVLLKAPYVVSDKCFFSLSYLIGQLLKVDSILAS